MLNEQVKAVVTHTGEVHITPYIKSRSFCQLDLTMYPFDETTCELKFGSRVYDRTYLSILNMSSSVDLSKYSTSSVWQIQNTSLERVDRDHLVFTKRPWDEYSIQRFSDLSVVLKLRRRFLYNYHFDIFIPCTVISIMGLLSFWLDPKDGEKISLGIYIMLGYIIYLQRVNKSVPTTSLVTPLITIYLTLVMLVSGLVVVVNVLLLNLHASHRESVTPPEWLKYLSLKILAKLLRINFRTKKLPKKRHIVGDFLFNSAAMCLREMQQREVAKNDELVVDRVTSFDGNQTNKKNEKLGPEEHLNRLLKSLSTLSTEGNRELRRRQKERRQKIKDEEIQRKNLKQKAHERRLILLEGVSNTMAYATIRNQEEKWRFENMEQWNMIAFVIDRLLFYIFSTVLLTSNLYLLMWRPFYNHLPHGHGTFAS